MRSNRLVIALTSLLLSTFAVAQQKPVDVIKTSLPKVVMIEVSGFTDAFESDDSKKIVSREVGWIGSGAFITDDGMILTCDHLFLKKLKDRSIIVKTFTGKKYRAMLLSEDEKKDVALIKVFPMKKLPFFKVSRTPLVRGQQVYAFGAPLQLEKTVSVGYVENLGVGQDKRTLHSASINPGNSGGPLVDNEGQLVGVNVSSLLVNIFMRAEAMGQAVSLYDIWSFLKE